MRFCQVYIILHDAVISLRDTIQLQRESIYLSSVSVFFSYSYNTLRIGDLLKCATGSFQQIFETYST